MVIITRSGKNSLYASGAGARKYIRTSITPSTRFSTLLPHVGSSATQQVSRYAAKPARYHGKTLSNTCQ